MKTDYNKEMERVIGELQGRRAKLILHACCAPCSSSVLERLEPYFEIVLFYYNPNIEPEEEYERRWAEFPKLLRANGMEAKVKLLRGEYDNASFREAARGMESEPEGGARCSSCFRLRLLKTAELARDMGADYFATTLTVSPHKNAAVINSIGAEIAERAGARWLPSDFKKRDGYLRSIRLAEEYGLYRQSWCGCSFADGSGLSL